MITRPVSSTKVLEDCAWLCASWATMYKDMTTRRVVRMPFASILPTWRKTLIASRQPTTRLPVMESSPKNHNLLEGWAKEDARYVVALATQAQVGQTINARNAELLLRRFASHPLSEVKKLGRAIYEQISSIAPSTKSGFVYL